MNTGDISEMRRKADDWRRPTLRQVEGPGDLKIYGGTIADDIDRWADTLTSLTEDRDRLREALRRISAGTEDAAPPFRAIGPSQMQSIARAALAPHGNCGEVK